MLELLDQLRSEARWATSDEQAVLARWSGWGALPAVFDASADDRAGAHAKIRSLLGADRWAQARRTTLNAHYTTVELAQSIWRAVTELGFDRGRVLEPGCGAGVFLGSAPRGEDVDLVGVEMDRTTAEIADHLYGGRAEIHSTDFARFDEPDGSFDLVIGNVPFGAITPTDPRRNRGHHRLHNYFIIKSLRLLRPGGILAVITSRYTLDASGTSARKEMAALSDLLGAVRLPGGAFRQVAGTDVVGDLIVLRRRRGDTEAQGPGWLGTAPLEDGDERVEPVGSAGGAEPAAQVASDEAGSGPVHLNEYWATHPEMVLGAMRVGRGMYRAGDLVVDPDDDTPLVDQFNGALDLLVRAAVAQGATYDPDRQAPVPRPQLVSQTAGTWQLDYAQEGSLVISSTREVGQVRNGKVAAYQPHHDQDFSELRRLIRLRDAVREVLSIQVHGGGPDDLCAAQQHLEDQYADYARIYGPLNRFRMVRTGHIDPESGEQGVRKEHPRMGGFRQVDPDWPLVAALEIFDEESQTVQRAAECQPGQCTDLLA